MVKERDFQKNLIKDIKELFPTAIVKKNDSAHIQGIPDLSVDIGPYSMHLEVKKSSKASFRPNQQHFLNHYNDHGGYARAIYPENKTDILNEMQKYIKDRSEHGME